MNALINQILSLSLTTRLFALANQIRFPFDRMLLQIDGQTMFAHRFDRYLALVLLKWNKSDPFDLVLISTLVEPGMQAIDIGANLGFYTLLLARYVGESGRVWAFEPDPGNFACLEKNVNVNQYANIQLFALAVGAKTEKARLYISGAHGGDHRIYAPTEQGRSFIEMDVVALDDFFAPGTRIDFIKMDIQGAEGLALAGMRRVLADNPDVILLMEFWPDGLAQSQSDPITLLQDLQQLGFCLEAVNERAQTTSRIEAVSDYVASLKHGAYQTILARRLNHL